MTPTAVLFDNDGLLLDTEVLWTRAEMVLFGKNGSDAYASRPDDPGAAKIESEKLDEAIKALDELSK